MLRIASVLVICICMNEQSAVQKLLHTKYEEIRGKNSAFSLRAFARRVEVSPSTLTRILNGERRVSRALADRLCAKLLLDPQERADVLDGFPQRRTYRKALNAPGKIQDRVDSSYLRLTADQFKIVSEWYHFAILSLTRTEGFKSEPSYIASRLGITLDEAESALERLQRLNMIEKNPEGQWVRSAPRYRTTDDVLNLSLQKSHRLNLEIAGEALTNVPVELRDFTAITMPASPKLLPKAKALIRKFQDDLCALLETEPGTEVYKFCAQLFPLTKPGGES